MFAVGCGSAGTHRAYMDSPARSEPEAARIWTRPQEVGISLGKEVRGEATTTSILFGLIRFGAEGGGLAELVGSFNSSRLEDPLVRAAAGAALRSTVVPSDGIYVTHHETSRIDFLIVSIRTAKVRGRAMMLEPLGEVSADRADRERNLRALGSGERLFQFPAPVPDPTR